MRLSIKVASISALVLAIPLIASSIFLVRGVSSNSRARATLHLESSARAAEGIYEKRLVEMRSAAQGLAGQIALNSLTGGPLAPERARLQDLLTHARDQLSLDFLIVTDAAGNVIARHNDLPAPNESLLQPRSPNPIAAKIINDGSRLQATSAAACVLEKADFLSRMWLDKVAHVDGLPSSEALVIESGAPIFESGKFQGVLLVGQMLNNYYVARPDAPSIQTPVVTEIRNTLYPNSAEGAGCLISLGDRIITSSVMSQAGSEPVLNGVRHDPGQSVETMEYKGEEYAVCWRSLKAIGTDEPAAIGVAVPASELGAGDSIVRGTIAGASVLTVLLAAAMGLLFGRVVSVRLNGLTEAVRRMSVGELSTSVREMDARIEPRRWWGSRAKSASNSADEVPERGSDGAALGLNSSNGSNRPSALNGPHIVDEIGKLADRLDQMRDSFRQAIERQRKR